MSIVPTLLRATPVVTLGWLCWSSRAQALTELRREHALAVVELQPRIDAAIERGVAWLLDQQQRDGSWFAHGGTFDGGQTALSAYTLLKAGLPPAHQGVRRAFAHLSTVRPTKVYAAGAMLLALAESGDPDHRPQMERIVADLLAWQDGSWAYPRAPGETGLHGDEDLSITQFALLGLRAAVRSGIKVPAAAWQDALRTVLRYQERPRTIEVGRSKVEVAGFRYHLSSPGNSTGAMTTAGLTSLCVAREALGRLSGDVARDVDAALQRGRAWIEANFDVHDNPGFKGQRWPYYLYGLERTSALLEIAYWGEHPWYLEGARALVERQGQNGAWAPDAESDTCFAILFLKRATAPTTGKSERAPRTVASDDAAADIAFKVVGRDDGGALTFLLTRVGAADGTRTYVVDKVEYTVDDVAVAAVEGAGRVWTPSLGYHGQWQPRARGKFRIGARAVGRRTGTDGQALGTAVTLEARSVEVTVKEALDDWMLPHATWRSRNLVVREAVAAAASSQFQPERAAANAVDGREGSAWVCAQDDPAPRLALTWDKAVSARTLVLTQANGARGWLAHFDLVRKVHIFVNGSKAPLVAELGADELAPTRIDLGKLTRIRRLDLAIVERGGARTHKGAAGFAEVALEKLCGEGIARFARKGRVRDRRER